MLPVAEIPQMEFRVKGDNVYRKSVIISSLFLGAALIAPMAITANAARRSQSALGSTIATTRTITTGMTANPSRTRPSARRSAATSALTGIGATNIPITISFHEVSSHAARLNTLRKKTPTLSFRAERGISLEFVNQRRDSSALRSSE